jgi:ssRNA-specific RNase YbeY (16S rRNA maturation enzyme)
VAERNARAIGHATDREVCFLIIHGLLHLCGHDHMQADDAEVMYEQQRLLLDLLTPRRGHKKPLWQNLVTKSKNLPRRRS